MDRINFDDNLSHIKMEKAKAAAALLNESWGGNATFTPGAAGSYTDGLQKEIEGLSTEDRKAMKSSFSVGVLETAMALNNTSFVELAEAKILVDKYINYVSIKGLSQAFLIEAMISELENFAWEKNVKPALSNLKKSFESNRKEIEVAKAIEEINGSGGRDLYSSIVETMRNWLASEERISEKLMTDLKKWSFNPVVRSLVERVSNLQSESGNKFNVKVNSSNCDVKSIIAPSLVTENSSVFVTSNRFFRATEDGVRIMEREEAGRLSGKFLKSVLALSSPNVKINESGLDLYIGKNKLSVVFESETDTKSIFFNGKRIAEDKLGFTLSFELRNGFQGSANAIDHAVQVVEAANYLSEIDFGKKIVSKIYEGVEANVFKFENRVFVHKVNPAMKKNELLEGNGSQAVNAVKEFLGFDLSESMTQILDEEDKFISIMKNDREEIKKNLAIVESEIGKINKALETNPALQNSEEIKEAQKFLSSESNSLKEKWNQISVEIERFEKGSKKTVVIESEGYGVNTDIKVNRNGEKGKVVGVNGNSKTYTVMFENGKTGEFFFNDVTDISDEIKNVQLTRIQNSNETNEGLEVSGGSQKNLHLVKAPTEKKAKLKTVIKGKKGHLAVAPGNHNKNGMKDHDPLDRASLAKAPVTKKN